MNVGPVKSPKIVLISNCTWNVHNFWMELIEQLYECGYQVLVLASADEYAPLIEGNQQFSFIPLQHLHSTSSNPWHDLLLMRELYGILKKEKPDALLTFTIKPNIYGCILAKMLNIQVVPTVTGLGYTFLQKGRMNSIVRKLYAVAFKGIPRVMLQNRADLMQLKADKILNAHQGLILAGAGVNTHFYAAAPMPQSAKFVFLFLGRILYDKGLRELAEAAQRIRLTHENVEFWVAGIYLDKHPVGVNKLEFQRWIDQGIFKYFGWKSDVRPLIQQANVIVLPSYREGLSSTLLEAMSMSRPLVVTDVPGCRETVVPGYNGWLAKVQDVQDLERALSEAIQTSPDILAQMGKNSREKAIEEFSVEQVNAAYLHALGKATFADVSLIEQ